MCPYALNTCFCCYFAAINKGRYTHEKKNNNIKEVKQLEQEQRAAASQEPPEDVVTSSEGVVALLSEQRLGATEDKFEKVIEDILTAFQEYALYGVNLFTSVKENQETFLASYLSEYKFLIVHY